MNERWVCKRCFADNEPDQAACSRCGLARDAQPTPSDQPAWAAQGAPAVAAEQPLWQKLLRFWWIPVIGVVLLVGYLQTAKRGDDGQLASAGTVSVQDLRIGDCFNSEEEEITDVDGVPCSESHTYEVFASGTYGGAGDPYPASDIEFDAAFAAVCQDAFEPYVGAPWETSMIYANMITPSEESWDDGDREFTCVLVEPVDPDNSSELVVHTESLRGAAR